MMTKSLWLASMLICLAATGCGNKDEPRPKVAAVQEAVSDAVDLVCSYAPSQNKAVLAISSAAGGTGAGAAAVASAAGLSAVAHSSGAYIFTGVTGYVAGTLGAAALVPVAVTVGAAASGSAITVELLCAPKNHPDLVAKVKEMATSIYDGLI